MQRFRVVLEFETEYTDMDVYLEDSVDYLLCDLYDNLGEGTFSVTTNTVELIEEESNTNG